MTRFGMWLLRPRVVREYRGWKESYESNKAYTHALLETVDEIYRSEILQRFWRHGELIANAGHQHPYQSLIPEQIEKSPRWFLLDSPVNPSPPWEADTVFKVFALALSLGSGNEQEWLIYAFTPLHPDSEVDVSLPGVGVVTVAAGPAGRFSHLAPGARSTEVVETRQTSSP